MQYFFARLNLLNPRIWSNRCRTAPLCNSFHWMVVPFFTLVWVTVDLSTVVVAPPTCSYYLIFNYL